MNQVKDADGENQDERADEQADVQMQVAREGVASRNVPI